MASFIIAEHENTMIWLDDNQDSRSVLDQSYRFTSIGKTIGLLWPAYDDFD
jgi:hypothetical protein